MKWTRKAKPRTDTCLWCSAEFQAIRWDARFCSPKCRKAFSRDPECAEFRRPAALQKLKALGAQHRSNIDRQWRLERKTFEKRITRALLDRDSDQLAKALYELREASRETPTRRLVFYPYRSWKRYCIERWGLDPEKVLKLTSPLFNPVIAEYLRTRQKASL
jgi:hypothetical protein